jgi:quinol monooxygenase YgiN
MVIAVLDMKLPSGHERATLDALRAFWDEARAQQGCLGGGIFQEIERSDAVLFIESWSEAAHLEAHVRSPAYGQLLAIMETSTERPALSFNVVSETRDLAWVETVRLRSGPRP